MVYRNKSNDIHHTSWNSVFFPIHTLLTRDLQMESILPLLQESVEKLRATHDCQIQINQVNYSHKTTNLFPQVNELNHSTQSLFLISFKNQSLPTLDLTIRSHQIDPHQFNLSHALLITLYKLPIQNKTLLYIQKVDSIPITTIVLLDRKRQSPLKYLIQQIISILNPSITHLFSKSAPHYLFPDKIYRDSHSTLTDKKILSDVQLTNWWISTLDQFKGEKYCVGGKCKSFKNTLPYRKISDCPLLEDDPLKRMIMTMNLQRELGDVNDVECMREIRERLEMSCDFRNGATLICMENVENSGFYHQDVSENNVLVHVIEEDNHVEMVLEKMQGLSFDSKSLMESSAEIYKMLDKIGSNGMQVVLEKDTENVKLEKTVKINRLSVKRKIVIEKDEVNRVTKH